MGVDGGEQILVPAGSRSKEQVAGMKDHCRVLEAEVPGMPQSEKPVGDGGIYFFVPGDLK
jgi:hypothetical protein